MSEWNPSTYGEIATFKKGINYKSSDYGSSNNGLPFITIKCVKKGGGYSARGLKFYKGEYNKDDLLKEGDVIFAITDLTRAADIVGSPLKMPRFSKDKLALASMDMMRISPDERLCDTAFLYHRMMLEDVRLQMAKYAAGSTVLHLETQKVTEISLDLPPINQQKKIAKILSTVDNLIEKTQALIDKYTSIKQGMMADLFTRGIDLTAGPNYGKLRPNVEDFPELYKETELGWVPNEWEVVALESIANVDRGKFTHRPRDDAKCYGGKHPFIQTGSVTKAKGGFITEYKQTLSDFGRSVSREFSAGTIAVTIAANIADTGILNIPMCFPDSIVGVNVDESKALIRYVEITIRRNKQRLDAIAPLSAQKNINLEDLRPLKVALPNMAEQIEICSRYESNEKLINKENANLEKIKLQKKGLMQDLLTGKVRVN